METEPVSQTAPHHHQQFTTSPPPGPDYLLLGQQNAVRLKRLKELLDLDGRTIRLVIRAVRLGGTSILADNQLNMGIISRQSKEQDASWNFQLASCYVRLGAVEARRTGVVLT